MPYLFIAVSRGKGVFKPWSAGNLAKRCRVRRSTAAEKSNKAGILSLLPTVLYTLSLKDKHTYLHSGISFDLTRNSYLAVDAHASSVIPAVGVQTCSLSFHLWVVITVRGMGETLAGWGGNPRDRHTHTQNYFKHFGNGTFDSPHDCTVYKHLKPLVHKKGLKSLSGRYYEKP